MVAFLDRAPRRRQKQLVAIGAVGCLQSDVCRLLLYRAVHWTGRDGLVLEDSSLVVTQADRLMNTGLSNIIVANRIALVETDYNRLYQS